MSKREQRINLVNRATLPLGIEMGKLCTALQEYVKDHLRPSWGVDARMWVSEPTTGWEIWFVDDAEQAGVLGFHDEEQDGTPRAFVCVRPTLLYGDSVSVVASHEIAEMLIDPQGNRGVMSPRGRWVALEICDPVETETILLMGDVPVSDFVYPSWFGGPHDGMFDLMGECQLPWELLPGGYIPVYADGRWSNLFGSKSAQRSFAEEDRRLHRTERRSRRLIAAGGNIADSELPAGVSGKVC